MIGMCPWCGEALHPGRRCSNDDAAPSSSKEQPNAAGQAQVIVPGAQTGCEPAPAAPTEKVQPTIHDRIIAAVVQAGNPDWSLREMIDTLRRIAVDARQFERELAEAKHDLGRGEQMTFDQDALDAASREVHMMLLREGSSWGTKACEEMGRVFMVAYQNALPSQSEAVQRNAERYEWLRKHDMTLEYGHYVTEKINGRPADLDAAIDAARSRSPHDG